MTKGNPFGPGFPFGAKDGLKEAVRAAAAAAGSAGPGTPGQSTVSVTTSSGRAGAAASIVGGEGGTVGNVAIVGTTVTIDGVTLGEEVREFTSASGRHYRIQRHDGRVDVSSG